MAERAGLVWAQEGLRGSEAPGVDLGPGTVLRMLKPHGTVLSSPSWAQGSPVTSSLLDPAFSLSA